MEQVLQEFKDRIAGATAERPLRIRGGGSKDWYGGALRGDVLDTRGWRGIVAYDPTELVITVRSGTPLAASFWPGTPIICSSRRAALA